MREALAEGNLGRPDYTLGFFFHLDRGDTNEARRYLKLMITAGPPPADTRLFEAFFRGVVDRDAFGASTAITAARSAWGRSEPCTRQLAEAALLVAKGQAADAASLARTALAEIDGSEEGAAFFARPFLTDMARIGAQGAWEAHLADVPTASRGVPRAAADRRASL